MFFVGEERVRTVLGEATKKDDLLKKSVIPKRIVPEKQSRANYGGTASSSRSGGKRSKSPEVRKFKGNRKGSDKGGRNHRGSGRSSQKRREEKEDDPTASPRRKNPKKKGSDKGECVLHLNTSNPPKSFTEA